MSTDIHTYIENIGGIDKLPEHGVDIHSPAHPVPIGLDTYGNPVTIDLTPRNYANMVVAGSTGTGKTNFLKALQDSSDILYPGAFEFVIVRSSVDVEAADYVRFRRQNVLSLLGVRNIWEYNEKYPENPMTEVILLIDEYPNKKLSDYDWKLLNEMVRTGRTLGIQQILTAQSPGKDLELFATRVCFRTTDATSNKILGSNAATKLTPAHAIIRTPFTEREVKVFESTRYSLYESHVTRDPLDPKNFLELSDLVQQIMRIPGEREIFGEGVIEQLEAALKVIYSPENLTRFNLHSSNPYRPERDSGDMWGITASNYDRLVDILAWFENLDEEFSQTNDVSDLLKGFTFRYRFDYLTEHEMLQAILGRAKEYCENPSILILAEIKALCKKFENDV